MPILWSEQAPDKIGETVESIKDLLYPMIKPIHKRSFSCYGCPEYVEHLKTINRRQILVTGIETHVCVYQTVRDLHRHGYEVHLIADAVSSRQQFDMIWPLPACVMKGLPSPRLKWPCVNCLKQQTILNSKRSWPILKGSSIYGAV